MRSRRGRWASLWDAMLGIPPMPSWPTKADALQRSVTFLDAVVAGDPLEAARLLASNIAAGDHRTLGYRATTPFCQRYHLVLAGLPLVDRRQVVAVLADLERPPTDLRPRLSQRAMALVLGVSRTTVRNDLNHHKTKEKRP